MGFSRQEYWRGLSFPPPVDLPDLGIESRMSPALVVRFFTTNGTWAGHKASFSSVAQSCLTLRDPMDCSTPCFPIYSQLPEFTQTHVHWVGAAIQPSHPLSSPSPPAFSLSQQQDLFKSVSSLHQVPKYWSFSFSISASNEYSRLISFRMDWLDLLAVQGALKSLLQHHSSKASIFRCSAFFIVQFSHPYMTTGKTIALTKWIFVGKVMSLLFTMLSRLVLAFLPRSKCLLITWLHSPSAVILEDPKIKFVTVNHFFPIYFPWNDGTTCHDLSFLKLSFKATFSLSSFTFIKSFSVPLHFLP